MTGKDLTLFDKSASLYDLIYKSIKNYEEESSKVRDLIERCRPGCRTVIDVACGTGEHCLHLSRHYSVDGLDINGDFVAIAAQKNPAGHYYQADMTAFSLGKKFDAVLCLFSSIGYVRTLDNLRRSLCCFRDHLEKDGVILVEPWFTPDTWRPGTLHMMPVEAPGLKLCRMSISEQKERLSFFTLHYLVGTSEGVRHFTEYHELGLFTIEEMKEAFRSAGLTVEYDSTGLSGRGLYVGRSVCPSRP